MDIIIIFHQNLRFPQMIDDTVPVPYNSGSPLHCCIEFIDNPVLYL